MSGIRFQVSGFRRFQGTGIRDQRLVGPTFAAQFERALANVLAVVTEACGQPCSIVRFTIYVTDKSLYDAERGAVGEGYRRVMGKHFPALVKSRRWS